MGTRAVRLAEQRAQPFIEFNDQTIQI